eukprot:scaffold123821_cov39-Attheya_sp.AAC.1
MGARNDIFRPLHHLSFRYQTRDKGVKLKFRACRASAYIGKPACIAHANSNSDNRGAPIAER